MDVSSEIVHALLPIFLTAGLGVSVAMVGLIDGIAEAAANISKLFSGYLSDRIGRRKPLILLGYGLAAATKPLFALASGAGTVLGARFADRIGKGIRGAPRDALITDVTPPMMRGRAFGLRQALDTAGAFIGPLLAILLMVAFANDIRAVFWVAVVPAMLAVLVVLFRVKDPPADPSRRSAPPLRIAEMKALPGAFWGVLAIGMVFTLARFSEAFLILKANEQGLPLALTPLVLVATNLVYSLGAYPAGIASDFVSPKKLLLLGLAALIAAYLLLALDAGLTAVFAGILLWGVHMALTQGLLSKLVADHSPERLRGSAFGLFNLGSGLALLAASVIAGLLWDQVGPHATFLAGAAFASAAFAAIAIRLR